MRTLLIVFIVISFSTPLYAADGIWQGLEQATGTLLNTQMELMRLEAEREKEQQRLQLEQQRFDAEQRNIREEQRIREEKRIREQERIREEQRVKNDQFISYMNDMVPDWRTIDNDPAFINWLNNPVPYTTSTKLQLLKVYVADFNAPMAAQFFIDYKSDRLKNCQNKCSSLHKKKKLRVSCKKQCQESSEKKSAGVEIKAVEEKQLSRGSGLSVPTTITSEPEITPPTYEGLTAEDWNNKAMSFFHKGSFATDLKIVIEYLNIALRLEPTHAVAYNNRGLAYINLGENQRAIEDLNKAILLNSKFVEAHNNRGLAYLNLNQYQRAIEDFNESIRLNPNFYKAYHSRAVTYSKLGNIKQGCLDAQKACDLGSCSLLQDAKGRGYCLDLMD